MVAMEMMSWYLLLIVYRGIHTTWAAVFKVTGPEFPIVAMVGGTAVLECQLIPEKPPPGMQIRWMRSDTKVPATVHLYRSGHDVPEDQNVAYAGRTELFNDMFNKGNVSLKLNDVQLEDEGDYLCMVEHLRVIEQASVPLKVTSLGLRPVIQLAGYQGSGIRIHCNSSGWYPIPSILWGSSDGQDLTDASQIETAKDLDGFYLVSSSIDVMSGPADVTCRVQASLLKDQRVSTLQIPAEFFPRMSKFFSAFMVFFILLLVVLFGAGWYYFRKRMDAKELFKRPTIKNHKTLMKELAALETCLVNAQANLEREKILSREAAERVLAASVCVTLDPDTANSNLAVSEDCLSISFQEEWKESKDDSERFTARLFVMAKEGYDAGCQYWEVWVGNKPDWDLGVAVEDIPKKEWIILSPSSGIWSISKHSQSYDANYEEPKALAGIAMARTIGIYLDHNTRSVHFYNAEAMSHIHTFKADFAGKIYPFFSPWGSQEIMRISPL